MYKIKFSVGEQIISIYCSQFCNHPIRSLAYCADILRYHVTDLIWLRYHGQVAEFRHGKYQIVPFWPASTTYHASLVSPIRAT